MNIETEEKKVGEGSPPLPHEFDGLSHEKLLATAKEENRLASVAHDLLLMPLLDLLKKRRPNRAEKLKLIEEMAMRAEAEFYKDGWSMLSKEQPKPPMPEGDYWFVLIDFERGTAESLFGHGQPQPSDKELEDALPVQRHKALLVKPGNGLPGRPFAQVLLVVRSFPQMLANYKGHSPLTAGMLAELVGEDDETGHSRCSWYPVDPDSGLPIFPDISVFGATYKAMPQALRPYG